MTPTPSKPDLVALADELRLLVDEYNPRESDWSFRKSVIHGVIDRLASQPSSYEAGLRSDTTDGDARYFAFRKKIEELVFDPIQQGGRFESEILARVERVVDLSKEALWKPEAAPAAGTIDPAPVEAPVAWLRDVGGPGPDDQHDECYVPAAKGDPGAFPVYRATPRPLPSVDEAQQIYERGFLASIQTPHDDGEDFERVAHLAGIAAILTLLGGSA